MAPQPVKPLAAGTTGGGACTGGGVLVDAGTGRGASQTSHSVLEAFDCKRHELQVQVALEVDGFAVAPHPVNPVDGVLVAAGWELDEAVATAVSGSDRLVLTSA